MEICMRMCSDHVIGVTGCGSIALGGAHLGPTIVYMAKVDDTATTTPETASWFKVNQTGLIQKWVVWNIVLDYDLT
jgi:predicted RNA methylase